MITKTKVFSFFLTAILLTVPFVSHAAPHVPVDGTNSMILGVVVKTGNSYELQVVDPYKPECSATAELGDRPVCMTLTVDLVIGGVPFARAMQIMHELELSAAEGKIVILKGGFAEYGEFWVYEVSALLKKKD
jgi:hypothetical protein